MASENSLVVEGLLLKLREGHTSRERVERQVVEIRLPTHPLAERQKLLQACQRRAKAPVELAGVLQRKVREGEARADIEGRLVQVGEKELRLGGVGDDEGQAAPGAIGLQRAAVVPGAKEPKQIGAKGQLKEAIHFIERHRPIGEVNVFRRQINVREQLLLHKAEVTLAVMARQSEVLVQIESDDVLETEPFLAVQADEFSVKKHRRAAGRQSQHGGMARGILRLDQFLHFARQCRRRFARRRENERGDFFKLFSG